MKTKYAIAARTDKNFNVGYWSQYREVVDTVPFLFDSKIEAEIEMKRAENIFKKRGYTMTLEVVKQILPD